MEFHTQAFKHLEKVLCLPSDWGLLIFPGNPKQLYLSAVQNITSKEGTVSVVVSGESSEFAFNEISRAYPATTRTEPESFGIDSHLKKPELKESPKANTVFCVHCDPSTGISLELPQPQTGQLEQRSVVDMSHTIWTAKPDYSEHHIILVNGCTSFGADGITLLLARRTYLEAPPLNPYRLANLHTFNEVYVNCPDCRRSSASSTPT